jgi:hypothetical protein
MSKSPENVAQIKKCLHENKCIIILAWLMSQKSNLYHAKVLTQNLKMWLLHNPLLCLLTDKQNRIMSICLRTNRTAFTLNQNFRFVKLNLELKGRRLDDIITLREQSHAAPAKFKTWNFCKYNQHCQSLDFLHQVIWELFQRGQHGTEGKCNYHREKSTILKWFYYNKYLVNTSSLFNITYLDPTVHESHIYIGLSLVKVPQIAIIQYLKESLHIRVSSEGTIVQYSHRVWGTHESS